MKKLMMLAFTASSSSGRQAIGSDAISGERQISLSSAKSSGLAVFRREYMPVDDATAASTCCVATEMRLVSWLALRTVLKQSRGATPSLAKMKVEGTRKPEVEFGSPIPKSRDWSQAITSS